MVILFKFLVFSGLMVGSFLIGRWSMRNAFFAGYSMGRKVSMWRAPNIRFSSRALVPESRRTN